MFYKILLSLICINVFAAPYELNKDHSKVGFDVDYMSLSKVEGRFKKFSATFDFDPTAKILKDVKATIDVKSIDTSESKRDSHLKGQEFFFTNKYPEIYFTIPGPINLVENKILKFKGLLNIRGIEKDIQGEIKYKGSAIDPWGKENVFFELNTKLNRQEFNMNWNKELDKKGYLVGDEVRIQVTIQGQKFGEKTEASTHMVPDTKGIRERMQLKQGKLKKLSTSTDPKDKN